MATAHRNGGQVAKEKVKPAEAFALGLHPCACLGVNMQPCLRFLLLSLGVIITIAISGCVRDPSTDTVANALVELRKMESYTRTGISYDEYSKRMLDFTATIDAIARKADYDTGVKIRNAAAPYNAALERWKEHVDGIRITEEINNELSYYWSTGSERIIKLKAP
ncbi:MAG: hypothetical protein LBK99_16500 [Opitutaceae bacterium]|nr:hypothetical protein [Opitutaceae bacterium]